MKKAKKWKDTEYIESDEMLSSISVAMGLFSIRKGVSVLCSIWIVNTEHGLKKRSVQQK